MRLLLLLMLMSTSSGLIVEPLPAIEEFRPDGDGPLPPTPLPPELDKSSGHAPSQQPPADFFFKISGIKLDKEPGPDKDTEETFGDAKVLASFPIEPFINLVKVEVEANTTTTTTVEPSTTPTMTSSSPPILRVTSFRRLPDGTTTEPLITIALPDVEETKTLHEGQTVPMITTRRPRFRRPQMEVEANSTDAPPAQVRAPTLGLLAPPAQHRAPTLGAPPAQPKASEQSGPAPTEAPTFSNSTRAPLLSSSPASQAAPALPRASTLVSQAVPAPTTTTVQLTIPRRRFRPRIRPVQALEQARRPPLGLVGTGPARDPVPGAGLFTHSGAGPARTFVRGPVQVGAGPVQTPPQVGAGQLRARARIGAVPPQTPPRVGAGQPHAPPQVRAGPPQAPPQVRARPPQPRARIGPVLPQAPPRVRAGSLLATIQVTSQIEAGPSTTLAPLRSGPPQGEAGPNINIRAGSPQATTHAPIQTGPISMNLTIPRAGPPQPSTTPMGAGPPQQDSLVQNLTLSQPQQFRRPFPPIRSRNNQLRKPVEADLGLVLMRTQKTPHSARLRPASLVIGDVGQLVQRSTTTIETTSTVQPGPRRSDSGWRRRRIKLRRKLQPQPVSTTTTTSV